MAGCAIYVAAKAEDRERFVIVVRFDNVADVPERLLVLIGLVFSNVMKRVWGRRMAIASSVVDSGDEADLPASTEVVNEGGWLEDYKLFEC